MAGMPVSCLRGLPEPGHQTGKGSTPVCDQSDHQSMISLAQHQAVIILINSSL